MNGLSFNPHQHEQPKNERGQGQNCYQKENDTMRPAHGKCYRNEAGASSQRSAVNWNGWMLENPGRLFASGFEPDIAFVPNQTT